jgi:hypothetical protein
MRRSLSVLASVCSLTTVVAAIRADDPSAARAILQRAIKAAGGEARLTKYQAAIFKSKGVLHGMGAGDHSYTQETAVQYPGRCRMVVTSDIVKKTIVLDDDRGWSREDGQTEELADDELAVRREGLYASWVSTLAPLDDKSFTVVPLGVSKVGARAVEGITVQRKGHPDLKLYFDKESGLLLKLERLTKSVISRDEMKEEIFLSHFKEIDGVQEPMKLVVKLDGRLAAEEEILELKHVEKLDGTLFAKP